MQLHYCLKKNYLCGLSDTYSVSISNKKNCLEHVIIYGKNLVTQHTVMVTMMIRCVHSNNKGEKK